MSIPLGSLCEKENPGAEAAVGLALGQETPGVGLVPGEFGALEERALVPGDAEPGEPVEDHLGVGVGGALLVCVLDAEHEGAAGLPGVEPVEEGGAGTADMEIAGGAGSEPDARYGHG